MCLNQQYVLFSHVTQIKYTYLQYLLLIKSWKKGFAKQKLVTCEADKVKSLLSHVHPDNALSSQLRVNRGELSPKSFIVDHILDSHAQLFSSHISIVQDRINSKFALVALGRATSAKLQNLDQHVNMVSGAMKSFTVKEEQTLNKKY